MSSKRRLLTRLDCARAEKKLNKVAKLLRKVNNDINLFVRVHGFTRIDKSQLTTSRHVFKHDAWGIVVKVPYLAELEAPAYSIPTVAVDLPDKLLRSSNYDYQSDVILIQPLAKVTKQEEGFKILCKRLYGNCDEHEGNVGWYKKCPVWIDW
jgi:hypothetical protein